MISFSNIINLKSLYFEPIKLTKGLEFLRRSHDTESQGLLNPYKPNGISRPYHLDESISNLRVAGW